MPQRWTREQADELRQAVGHFVRVGRSHDVMPRPRAAVLGYLDREGSLSIAGLARHTGVRHQTMRVTVASMQDAGLVELTPSEQDGRMLICSITDAGRTELDQDREARTTWILEGLRGLDADQQAAARQMAEILRVLADADESA